MTRNVLLTFGQKHNITHTHSSTDLLDRISDIDGLHFCFKGASSNLMLEEHTCSQSAEDCPCLNNEIEFTSGCDNTHECILAYILDLFVANVSWRTRLARISMSTAPFPFQLSLISPALRVHTSILTPPGPSDRVLNTRNVFGNCAGLSSNGKSRVSSESTTARLRSWHKFNSLTFLASRMVLAHVQTKVRRDLHLHTDLMLRVPVFLATRVLPSRVPVFLATRVLPRTIWLQFCSSDLGKRISGRSGSAWMLYNN